MRVNEIGCEIAVLDRSIDMYRKWLMEHKDEEGTEKYNTRLVYMYELKNKKKELFKLLDK